MDVAPPTQSSSVQLPAGCLVVVAAGTRLPPLEESLREPSPVSEAIDISGSLAQLLHGDEIGSPQHHLICTLRGGQYFRLPRECIRLLSAEELANLDADLVLGPASKLDGIAKQMATLLSDQGYATTHVVASSAERQAVVDAVTSLDQDGLLNRLPASFEPGYLGTGPGGKGKVALLEALLEELPAEMLGAALPVHDGMLTSLSQLLSPLLHEILGFRVHSRTNLMFRLPFQDGTDEERYPPPDVEPQEADGFLALMGRKRLCTLHCVGPGLCRVRLLPRAPEFAEVLLTLSAGSLLVFVTDFYDYEFEPEGITVALQSLFLERPLEFSFQTSAGSASGTGVSLELTPEDLPVPIGPGLPAGEPVCIVGMASRDPCYADDHEKLWTAIRHGGCDGFLEIPYWRFDIDQYVQYDDQALAVQNGKSYCRHQGHCEGLEIFDAAFFNVPQQDAYGMDPEQRIVLETGWLAMSDAGFDRKKTQKESAHLGVFVGISSSDWRDVCTQPSANGIPETFIANRFSYVVNLKGPSFISNTACSASLVAMHTAKVHVLFPTDPLDGALVAGVSLNTSPGTWIGNCSGNMLSFQGRSFSFNSTCDGYGRGEGCAAAVIRPCEYDPTDPSTYALLAGSHTNSDGRSASLTAPNGPAQQRLLRAILSETQVEAKEICVYEAHGTGTSLGDPIEIGAVRKVLTHREHPLMISCSKTNLGHLEGGAGMSSLCKCVMACMHAECAPNQHLSILNPHLDIDNWPSLILTEGAAMRGDTSYVGVSGFGYGGTNAHSLMYARNTITSRGGANPKHIERSLVRKVKSAAVPEVYMEGESYEEWITTGVPHLMQDLDTNYRVEVTEEGGVVWQEVSQPDLSEIVAFQIQGSFSNWEMVSLEPSDEEASLYSFHFVMGMSGKESFQIAVDHDPCCVFYPEQLACTRQVALILGPASAPSKDHAWLVQGTPGAKFRVDFFQSGDTVAVMWKETQEMQAQGFLMEHGDSQE